MMKNKATLKFKNFTARPRSFWIRIKLARAGTALCYSRPADAVCLEISSADAKPMSKNLKSLNFKNGNATSTNCEAGRYIDFSADYDTDRDINFNAYRDINSSADRGMCHGINSSADRDINFGIDRAANFKISNANLKADLAHQKAGFR